MQYFKKSSVFLLVITALNTHSFASEDYLNEASELVKGAENNSYSLPKKEIDRLKQLELNAGTPIEQIETRENFDDGTAILDSAIKLVDELKTTNKTLKELNQIAENKNLIKSYSSFIFISYSLGDQALSNILTLASKQPKTAVVMRGIPKDMNLGDGLMAIQNLAAKFDPIPNIIVDPTLFKEYNVNLVPTTIVLDEQRKEEKGRVKGLLGTDWVYQQIKEGKGGDFGVKGQVAEIDEPDLVEEAQRRANNIDWNQKKKDAEARIWSNQNFYHLPTAFLDRTRYIDASVELTKDIQGSDGSYVGRAGDIVNPLDFRAWTQGIIVYNSQDQKQVDIVKRVAPELLKDSSIKSVMYITTDIDTDKGKGWDSYKKTTDDVNDQVYLLTPDMIERFDLQKTPSIITANKTHFIVKEIGVTQDEGSDQVENEDD